MGHMAIGGVVGDGDAAVRSFAGLGIDDLGNGAYTGILAHRAGDIQTGTLNRDLLNNMHHHGTNLCIRAVVVALPGSCPHTAGHRCLYPDGRAAPRRCR